MFDPLRNNPRRYLQAVAEIAATNIGTGQLTVTDVRRLSPDPLGVFPDQRIGVYPTSDGADIDIQAGYDPGYAANPYDLVLLIESNGGDAVITVPAVPAMTAGDIDRVIAEAQRMVANCT